MVLFWLVMALVAGVARAQPVSPNQMAEPGKPAQVAQMAQVAQLAQVDKPFPPLGSRDHEYGSLRNVTLDLEDFKVTTSDGRKTTVGELLRDRKIVLLHFFATFCHNSNFDVVTINELYRQYGEAGFQVVGISEYSTRDELQKFMTRHKTVYPMVMESETGRTKTRHYRYRTRSGDERKWGTPFSMVIDGREIDPSGAPLARRMHVASGELVRAEIESLIRRRLAATP